MDEYIEREAAYREICADNALSGYEKAYCSELIRNIQAADVATVVHGRWEPHPKHPEFDRCSACCNCIIGDDWADDEKWNYCPNCGAKMDGVFDG